MHTLSQRWLNGTPTKAAANLRKHGVDFADAETALRGRDGHDCAGRQPQRRSGFVTLGDGALGRLLVVVYEWRNDDPQG